MNFTLRTILIAVSVIGLAIAAVTQIGLAIRDAFLMAFVMPYPAYGCLACVISIILVKAFNSKSRWSITFCVITGIALFFLISSIAISTGALPTRS